jgi:hypothetical protein
MLIAEDTAGRDSREAMVELIVVLAATEVAAVFAAEVATFAAVVDALTVAGAIAAGVRSSTCKIHAKMTHAMGF